MIVQKRKALNTYRSQAVNTASPGELILLLYNETLRCIREAILKLGAGDLEAASKMMLKSQEILQELQASLNMEAGGEVADYLRSIYLYVHGVLVKANLEKNPALLEDAFKVIEEIRQGWGEMLGGKTVSKTT